MQKFKVESHHVNELMLKFDFGSGDFNVDFKPNWYSN